MSDPTGPKAIVANKATKATLTYDDFSRAAQRLRCDVAAVKAVAAVESRGAGFLPDGQPVILFERHIFHRLTKERWTDAQSRDGIWLYRDISNPKPGGYGAAGQHQHDRLAKAVALDREAALQSASWGMFQIMGFNWQVCGYPSLQAFINAMYRSEGDHLDAFVEFNISQGLDSYLRNHQWSNYARRYNGKQYAKHNYHGRLANAWKRFREEG